MKRVILQCLAPWGVTAWARRAGATAVVSALGVLGVLLASLPAAAITIPQAITTVSTQINGGSGAGEPVSLTDYPGTTSLTRTSGVGAPLFVMASASTEGFFSTSSPSLVCFRIRQERPAIARATSRLAGWQGSASASSQLRYFVALVQTGTAPLNTLVPVDITFTLALGKSSSVEASDGFGSATG